MTDRVAIVGAGAAGAATAYGLRGANADVTVFERRSEAGGRAATRRRRDCVYDVGANYLSVESDRVQSLVDGPLADALVAVDGDVWTVDAEGEIAPGRDADDPKLTGRAGVAAIAEELLERAGTTPVWNTDVVGVQQSDAGNWAIQTGPNESIPADADGRARSSTFDHVVLTPPAPATAELLLEVPVADGLREAARSIEYRPITTVAAAYDHRVEWPYYALVDTSKSRALGWVAREECKPDHVPAGESLLILQASPEWSRTHRRTAAPAVAEAATDLVAALVDDPRLATPEWTDVVRWRHALTDDGLAPGVRSEPAAAGLHVAGDWVEGTARIDAALRSGLETAERLDE
ncbi:NAD(P)/FAD-dependent oxidoreductase [Salinarchaeum chitinilyticum]